MLQHLGFEMVLHNGEGQGSNHQEELRFSERLDSVVRHTGASTTMKTIGL